MLDCSSLGSMGGSLRLRGRPRPHLGSLLDVEMGHFGEHDVPTLGVVFEVLHRVSAGGCALFDGPDGIFMRTSPSPFSRGALWINI